MHVLHELPFFVITDENGTLVEATEYLPYGQEQSQPGLQATQYRFTDQELDPSTGLYNYDARLYDPVVGRFISADSIVPNWYDPQLLNRYSYVRNNPLKYVDPDGHVLETAWDVANIGIGIYSFVSNVSSGNWGSAALDAGGGIVDVAATAVPFIPGGAGIAIKVARAADKTADAVKKIDKAVDTANVARKSDKIADAPKRGTTKLYRAVKQAELDDIAASSGKFKNPAGIESKYFSKSPEGAASYAKQTYQRGGALYEGPYTIVETKIPTSSIKPDMTVSVDRGISTVVVPSNKLPSLAPGRPLNYSPIP